MPFPHVDPIPVPAPIWLMKVLLLLTLALHFVAVQILIGSLVAICWFSFRGKVASDQVAKTVASVLARRVTIVMTFLINLGIPPLLFAQVLYGRALYTSSVLIGVIWISIIFLLMACYALLYRVQYRTANGEPAFCSAFIALLLAAGVGRILSLNMTLMLRPEVWSQMYAHSARGIFLPPSDPTGLPRWGFMMVGGLLTSGLWMLLHSGLTTIEDDARNVLRRAGSFLVVIGGFAQVAVGYAVLGTQPAVVRLGLVNTAFYKISMIAWIACVVLTILLGGVQIGLKKFNPLLTGLAWLTGFLSICSAVIVRDGIRDLTLASKGFDVWARTEVSNWGVLIIFFILFVVSLGVIGWLLLVMRQARSITEQVTS